MCARVSYHKIVQPFGKPHGPLSGSASFGGPVSFFLAPSVAGAAAVLLVGSALAGATASWSPAVAAAAPSDRQKLTLETA